jgi:protein-disulfide isomerase
MPQIARRIAEIALGNDADTEPHMRYFRFSALSLSLVLALTSNTSATPNAAERSTIEKAYAAKLEAESAADIAQRITARWQALANDPASPVIGNGGADVTIVEFFDYTCPYCKAVEPRLEFPILAPQSLIASRAALAAIRQGKYTAYHNAMMRFEGRLTEADIFDMAKAAGLDLARLKRDMGAPWISDQIIAVFNLARGIRGFQTPIFIVNGKQLGSESAAIDFRREVALARRK